MSLSEGGMSSYIFYNIESYISFQLYILFGATPNHSALAALDLSFTHWFVDDVPKCASSTLGCSRFDSNAADAPWHDAIVLIDVTLHHTELMPWSVPDINNRERGESHRGLLSGPGRLTTTCRASVINHWWPLSNLKKPCMSERAKEKEKNVDLFPLRKNHVFFTWDYK